MENEMLTTHEAAKMTAAELRTYALTAPRAMSLFCTRYAAAKDAATLGDDRHAKLFLEAAKEAYKVASKGELFQLLEVRATAAVVAERGAAQDAAKAGGKHVSKLRMERGVSTWQNDWIAR